MSNIYKIFPLFWFSSIRISTKTTFEFYKVV